MDDEATIHTRFAMLSPFLNERTRRLLTAAEAAAPGRGGIATVARARWGLPPGDRRRVGRIARSPGRVCLSRPPPLARALNLQLKEAESQRATRGRPDNLEAIDYARKAWAELWTKPQTKETNDQRLSYL